jgi:hypothetical protein
MTVKAPRKSVIIENLEAGIESFREIYPYNDT